MRRAVSARRKKTLNSVLLFLSLLCSLLFSRLMRRKKSGNWSEFRRGNLDENRGYRLSIPMAHTTDSFHRCTLLLLYLHCSFCKLLVCDNIDYRFQWHTRGPRSTEHISIPLVRSISVSLVLSCKLLVLR